MRILDDPARLAPGQICRTSPCGGPVGAEKLTAFYAAGTIVFHIMIEIQPV
ncbi:MAG: hypothetical protein HYX78_02250 [Armatimonadetes bacterium]|nr:hypothetical protein [Armatimonadota bacterium]